MAPKVLSDIQLIQKSSLQTWTHICKCGQLLNPLSNNEVMTAITQNLSEHFNWLYDNCYCIVSILKGQPLKVQLSVKLTRTFMHFCYLIRLVFMLVVLRVSDGAWIRTQPHLLFPLQKFLTSWFWCWWKSLHFNTQNLSVLVNYDFLFISHRCCF